MGDPPKVKTMGEYLRWTEPEHRMLLELLVDATNNGLRDASGQFNKLTVEQRILPVLHQKLGSTKNYANYRNRIRILKTKYNRWADLFRFSSGFGWNHETKKVTALDEVWNAYLEAHSGNENLRDETQEDLEELTTIFGQTTATRQNSVGLGGTNDAQINPVINTEGENDISYVQMMEDATELIAPENIGVSSVRSSRVEKLPQRKKARTDAIPSKVSDEVNKMTELSNQIFGMLQTRWEKEAQEKEVEDKANNVWDAIKEIPDLDEDMRYEAMNLVHSLGMKSGFVNMSVAERYGWIKRNIRKPNA